MYRSLTRTRRTTTLHFVRGWTEREIAHIKTIACGDRQRSLTLHAHQHNLQRARAGILEHALREHVTLGHRSIPGDRLVVRGRFGPGHDPAGGFEFLRWNLLPLWHNHGNRRKYHGLMRQNLDVLGRKRDGLDRAVGGRGRLRGVRKHPTHRAQTAIEKTSTMDQTWSWQEPPTPIPCSLLRMPAGACGSAEVVGKRQSAQYNRIFVLSAKETLSDLEPLYSKSRNRLRFFNRLACVILSMISTPSR